MHILLTGPPGLFREGVEALLREFAKDVEVWASDGLTADAWAHGPDGSDGSNGRQPDCVVVDGDHLLHAGDELEFVRARTRTTPFVVLLGVAERDHVEALIAAGVSGCVEKSASRELLFSAMRLAFAGGVYLPRALVAARLPEPHAADSIDVAASIPIPDPHLHLTPRQIEVLALLARGRSNKTIARQLQVAEATVKTHLTTIFKALNVSSRGEASAVAARMEKIREAQADKAVNGRIAMSRLLANMELQRYRSGEVLFRKGDPGSALFYVEKGVVRLSELDFEMGAGSMLGEIGLFSPEHRRTSTVVCKTDCEMRKVSADEAIRLYYQEPEFALYVVRLIASRLQADKSRSA